ncbi:unnamed protein product [Rodentolepis nana]|uniref:Cadherin domain-containing protein n=1 Tax=Rodentolepis nana TaxID=102285 RepID=A0A0R3TQP0_RODNA|nr:unnamed protein product [Rodentolepis nana]
MKPNILNPTPYLLMLIYYLLPVIQKVDSGSNTSQVYIFLREEETAVGNVILSSSRTMYIAKVYAKRGIYSVLIEEPIEPSPEFFYPENMYSMPKSIKYFSLNEHTGLMKVNERLDFDNPEMEAAGCVRNEAKETLKLLQQNSLPAFKTAEYCCFPVEIISGGEERLALHVCIEDINDNAPEWSLQSATVMDLNKNSSLMALSIPENLPLDSAIDIPSATDRDSGVNSALTYEIWPDTPEFDVVWNASTSKLCLYIRKELDRETESSYNFTIIAHDGGLESKSGSVSLAISVEDVNDNDPVFEESTYIVTIPEDTNILTPIIQVNATDSDLGINADISYSISTLTDPEFSQMFSIDDKTGWISLEKELDFENYKQISLTIAATDLGEIPRQSTCLVEINLTDVNDNAPKLLFEPGSLTNNALVPENEIAGRIVAVFTVVDEDSGANADTTCWIKSVIKEKVNLNSKIGAGSMNEKENFKMEAGKVEEEIDTIDIENYFKLELMALPFAKVYQLSTVAIFDREVGSKYCVGITCADTGAPSLNTTGYVLVRIQDVNDQAPQFPNRHFTFRLPENQPTGKVLFKLTANDLDEGKIDWASFTQFFSTYKPFIEDDPHSIIF